MPIHRGLSPLSTDSDGIDADVMSPGALSIHRPKSRSAVMLVELRCVVDSLRLLMRGGLRQPRDEVDEIIEFADGSHSRIYRETVTRPRTHDNLVLLAVRFRLRFIGSSRLLHRLFRLESLLNTLLFAAHPGFQTKLWLTDESTWLYRGIYEWEGEEAAREYAETLRVVLRPWVEPESFDYHVTDWQPRDNYLLGWSPVSKLPPDPWWVPSPARLAPGLER